MSALTSLAVLLLQPAVSAPLVPRYTIDTLTAQPTAALSEAIFGAGTGFQERRLTRIPGVAQWVGVSVDFAAPPEPTGYAGLCRYASGSAYFRWHYVTAPGETEWLGLASRERGTRYLLTTGNASLRRTSDPGETAACAAARPVFGDRNRDLTILVRADGSRATPATAEQAAFALGALRIARQRFPTHACRYEAQRCEQPLTIGGFDPAQVYSIVMEPCNGRASERCVVARIDRGAGAHVLRIGLTRPGPDGADGVPRVRSARLSFELWPVA